jgi:two-component system, OmpR family, sensor kinase
VNRLRHPRLALKFGLALFAIVAGALLIVYLAVVPRLESRLVNAKLDDLERASGSVVREFDRPGTTTSEYQPLAQFFSSSLGARVVVLQHLGGRTMTSQADSSGLPSTDVLTDPVARKALDSGTTATGRLERGDSERAEVAVPLDATTVVLLSAQLKDALADVALVKRTLIVAGLASLAVSLLVGALAAWRFTRRIRRLESAAERIAAGDFDHPVSDPSQDEVGELAQAFDSMRLRLAQLDHARREFIANASHELRTPLFSLGGFLELMANEDLDERERKDFVEEMAAQVGRLTKLATDLLDLSRLDAGQLAVERSPVDLAAVAQTVAEEARALAETSGHVLSVRADSSVVALADEQRVLQIARNLVENALKHTPAGTNIVIEAAWEGGNGALSVRDDGPGVPAGDQEHLFERFYRADGGKASGSGLGLAIAHELARHMDGSLDLRSKPRETVFGLVLPPAPTPAHGVSTGKRPVAAPG